MCMDERNFKWGPDGVSSSLTSTAVWRSARRHCFLSLHAPLPPSPCPLSLPAVHPYTLLPRGATPAAALSTVYATHTLCAHSKRVPAADVWHLWRDVLDGTLPLPPLPPSPIPCGKSEGGQEQVTALCCPPGPPPPAFSQVSLASFWFPGVSILDPAQASRIVHNDLHAPIDVGLHAPHDTRHTGNVRLSRCRNWLD